MYLSYSSISYQILPKYDIFFGEEPVGGLATNEPEPNSIEPDYRSYTRDSFIQYPIYSQNMTVI